MVVKMLKSGQIIKTVAYTFVGIPFIYHYGLILNDNDKLYVIHNDRIRGTIKEPYNEFITNKGDRRKIAEIKSSKLQNLSNDELLLRFNSCKGNFSWFNYNCEHFVQCVSRRKQKSEQLIIASILAISVVLILKLK